MLYSLLKPFGSLLNLTMSNSVGDQKALVANKHIFRTKAFWFPTESSKKAYVQDLAQNCHFPF